MSYLCYVYAVFDTFTDTDPFLGSIVALLVRGGQDEINEETNKKKTKKTEGQPGNVKKNKIKIYI